MNQDAAGAESTGQPRRNRLKVLGGALGAGLVALIGWIATHPVDTVNDFSLAGRAAQGFVNPPPSNLVVFMSDEQYLPSVYESILEHNSYFRDRRFTFEQWYPDQIQALKDRRPLVVIFGAGQADADLPDLPGDVMSYLRSGVKVVGMGVWGGRVFQQLAPNSLLALGNLKAVASSEVVLAQSQKGLPSDAFSLYSDGEDGAQLQAIYDNGNLNIGSIQLIAQATKGGGSCVGHYWPVAEDQNFLFWGFTGTRLTADGASLFASLLDGIAQVPTSAQDPRAAARLGERQKERLACNLPVVRYQFQLLSTQAVRISVTPLKDRVNVVLTGPEPLPPIVRSASADAPFTPITQHGVRGDDNWLLTVAYSGEMTEDTVDSVNITKMLTSDPPPLVAVIGIPVGVIVVGVVVVALLRWRGRELAAALGAQQLARWARRG